MNSTSDGASPDNQDSSLAGTLQRVKSLYGDNLRAMGPVAAAVGWNSPESQTLRFRQLLRLIDGRVGPLEVNDYGCGYGALLSHLLAGGREVSAYHGYDLSPAMLDAARVALADFTGALHLHRSDTIATDADVSFVSGTFNVRFDATEAVWNRFIMTTLDAMHERSREGFAFNLLSTYVDWHSPSLHYADPRDWFDHCKRRYSRHVTLLHDYPLWEWTLLVRRSA
jgi:SAM-dependent methyltransferase